MPSLSAAKAFSASYTFSSTTPVAILVGASGGIGASIAEALARYTNGNVHLVVVARNEEASRKVLQTCVLPLSPTDAPPLREFVHCDYALVQSTKSAIEAVSALLKGRKIDYLVFSSNFASLANKRNDTEEGHDYQLRIRYYHRFQMTYAFAASGLLGESSRVMTILGAGKKGSKVQIPGNGEDFEFRTPEVGSGKLGAVVSGVYTDIGFKTLASRYPSIGFTHIHPGFVRTGMITDILDGLYKKPIMGPAIYFLANALVSAITILPDKSAEYMVYALLNGQGGEGGEGGKFHRRDRVGNEIKEDVKHEGVNAEKLFEHSVKVTEAA